MGNKMLCSVYHGYQVTCFHWGTRMPPSWGHTAHSSHSDTFSSTPPRSTPPGRVSGTSPLSSPVGNHTMRPLATSLRHFCMDGLSWGKCWINERYKFILQLAELKYSFYGQHNFHHLEDKQEVRGGGGGIHIMYMRHMQGRDAQMGYSFTQKNPWTMVGPLKNPYYIMNPWHFVKIFW